MLFARTIRDWRGVKHRLSQYTTDELGNSLACALHAQDQVDRFIEAIERELAQREEMSAPAGA